MEWRSIQGANGVIGRSVVMHARGDDFSGQSDGASGDRLVCGAVGMARP
jgi:Cu/Zn superoxide dismutase